MNSSISVSLRPSFLAIAATCLSFSAAFPALAQTASQIVQPSYAPPVMRSVEGGIALPEGGGVEAPAGAAGLKVKPSGLAVSGSLPGLEAETAEIEARLKDKRVSGADLFAAAADLEAAYGRAGYLLVRVSLPPQTLRDGQPLKLVVTDGYVEAIDTSALPEQARKRVEAVLTPLVGQRGLTRGTLERRLLLAGDIPGAMLRSTLKAGTKPGATVIVVDGRYDAVTGQLFADNGLSDGLGRYSVGVGADFNNVLGLGEVAYVRLTGYPGSNDSIFSSDPRNRQIVAGFTLPITTDGLWFGMEGVDSRTHPTSDFGYTMVDHYQRLSTRLGYSWVRSRDLNTSSVISFDIADEEQTIDLGGLRSDWSEDRTRVLRLTQKSDVYLPWGAALSGEATLSFGLDAFGARNGTLALPLSRDGAEPDFTKLEVSGRYSQSLMEDRLQLSVSGKAQTSFGDPLVSSEQMGLGGFDWLSAYGSGEVEGDTGAVFRAELSMPMAFPQLEQYKTFGSVVSPYAFAAAGIARLEQASAVEDDVTRAASFGAGVRFGLSEKASPFSSSLSMEYAHGAASGTKGEDRFNIRFMATF